MNEQRSSVDADGDKSIPSAMLKVKVALVFGGGGLFSSKSRRQWAEDSEDSNKASVAKSVADRLSP